MNALRKICKVILKYWDAIKYTVASISCVFMVGILNAIECISKGVSCNSTLTTVCIIGEVVCAIIVCVMGED